MGSEMCIRDRDSSSVITAYEKRIGKMESDKALLIEKQGNFDKPRHSFEEVFQLAMSFLSNPHKLWTSGEIAHRQTVLKLAFTERPTYTRENGFSNPKKALPFKLLEGFCGNKSQMADRAGFEPARRFPAYTLSKRAPSATRPPVLFHAISALRDAKYRLVKSTYKGKKSNYQQFCPFIPPKA